MIKKGVVLNFRDILSYGSIIDEKRQKVFVYYEQIITSYPDGFRTLYEERAFHLKMLKQLKGPKPLMCMF